VQDAQGARKLSLEVGEHREGETLQVAVIFTPRKMTVLRVSAAAEYLTIELREIGVLITELSNLSWAYEGEVERPKEYYLPLSLVGGFRDSLELFAVLKGHACF
jgi:hypothetical protein